MEINYKTFNICMQFFESLKIDDINLAKKIQNCYFSEENDKGEFKSKKKLLMELIDSKEIKDFLNVKTRREVLMKINDGIGKIRNEYGIN